MSNEIAIQQTSLTGQTLYATLDGLVSPNTGLRWNGTAFEAVTAADWASYAVAMTEATGTGFFTANQPAGIPAGTPLAVTIYQQIGSSPAATDPVKGSGAIGMSAYAGADTVGTTTLLSRISSTLTIAGGKVAATVATGDGVDSAALKATVGLAGAGLSSIPYTGPAALTDYQQRGVTVTLPASPPSGFLVAGSFGTGAITGTVLGASAISAIATGVLTDVSDTLGADVVAIKTVTDHIATGLQSNGSGGYQYTTTALALAPTGSGSGGSDPWATALPGSYASGTAGAILGQNLDARISTRSTFAGGVVASVSAPVTVGTVNDKTGYALSSSGLDSISTTPAAFGVTPNFRQMVVSTWRRWFRKHIWDGTTLTGFADDGTTVLTSQSLTVSGSTQIQGPSA